ncbi:hypothetical protein HYZ76_02675 [Candidatus Falkowbacteria bacterium]|nr:hypothetical protein [Candidatus Falkowbacteria bacterium]
MEVNRKKQFFLQGLGYELTCRHRQVSHQIKLYLDVDAERPEIFVGENQDLTLAFAAAVDQMLKQMLKEDLAGSANGLPKIQGCAIRISDGGEYHAHLFWNRNGDSNRVDTGRHSCREHAMINAFSAMCQKTLGVVISLMEN